MSSSTIDIFEAGTDFQEEQELIVFKVPIMTMH